MPHCVKRMGRSTVSRYKRFYAWELAYGNISYGNSVRLSICHNPVPYQIETLGFHHMIASSL